MSIKTDFSDFLRLQRSIKRMGGLPQKCVTKAARKGAKQVLTEARRLAPYQFGFLEKGIVLVGERSKTKGKKVFQVTLSRKMNDVFQKPIQNPGKYGGESKTAYYPASMEYGFKTSDGARYGEQYMHNAAKNTSKDAKHEIMSTLSEELDKEWAKK